MRFVGERKAVAAIVLAFFGLQFLLSALLGPRPFMAMLLGLAVCYLVGFFGVVAGYFWARWFSLGLGISGCIIGVLLIWQIGLDPATLLWALPHLALLLCLVGSGPRSVFDGRPEWRERWKMDEHAVNRLGKSVTRAGASLPYLIMAGLAPRQDLEMLLALFAGAAGLWALVRFRSWGVLAVGAAAALAALGIGDGTSVSWLGTGVPVTPVAAPLVATVLLVLAFLPFARPLARYLLHR